MISVILADDHAVVRHGLRFMLEQRPDIQVVHVANLLSKLHLTDRTQAAIYALQQHLVPLKDALDKEE